MGNSPFLNDSDFFKSHTLSDGGQIMLKASGHKYIKRTGTSGNYKYWYRNAQGKIVEGKAPTEKKDPTKDNSLETGPLAGKPLNDKQKATYKELKAEKLMGTAVVDGEPIHRVLADGELYGITVDGSVYRYGVNASKKLLQKLQGNKTDIGKEESDGIIHRRDLKVGMKVKVVESESGKERKSGTVTGFKTDNVLIDGKAWDDDFYSFKKDAGGGNESKEKKVKYDEDHISEIASEEGQHIANNMLSKESKTEERMSKKDMARIDAYLIKKYSDANKSEIKDIKNNVYERVADEINGY